MRKFVLTQLHASQIDTYVLGIGRGQTAEFGDIGLAVFGNRYAGGAVGGYVYRNRFRLNGWWRVVNRGNHPVADDVAIRNLKAEGHSLVNGVLGH
jgi:alkylated DNA nucleotide flippase Atl1